MVVVFVVIDVEVVVVDFEPWLSFCCCGYVELAVVVIVVDVELVVDVGSGYCCCGS